MIEIENLSLEEWLSCIKPYQKAIINQLVDKYGEEKAAKIWLISQGPLQTAKFGGNQMTSEKSIKYWDRLKNEIGKFICGHPDYEDERKKFLSGGKLITIGSVTGIANFLGSLLGITPAIILPSLLLLLHTVTKMGIKAYCSTKENE
jgi:VIT1/CCC1 family predicted Fe2+/Mn2+ transporter